MSSENINLILNYLRNKLPDIPKNKRGRPTKHSIKDYLILIVIKEFRKASLRAAETEYSRIVCNSRVDHSVIHYWEKNIARDVIEEIIRVFGSLLEELLSYSISIIDATSFANWYNETMSFHCL